ncbi:MAG: histidine kinase, partial [Clostridiales bacterium]
MKENILSLCREYTDLSSEEIAYIKKISMAMDFLSDTEEADVFINCACSGGDSVIVAQAKPKVCESAYDKYILGMFSKPMNEPAVERTLRLGLTTKRVKAISQENRQIIQITMPIKYKERTIGVMTYERLNTFDGKENGFHEYFNTPDKYQKNHKRSIKYQDFRWILDNMEGALLIIDSNGIVVFRNESAKKLYFQLGYAGDVLGQEYRNLSFGVDDFDSAAEVKVGRFYFKIMKIDSSMEGIFGILIYDITLIKRKEKELILKSIVIQEMHHRIKNSLQIISSLISLQSRRINCEESRKLLVDTISRIQAIAAAHQLLSESVIGDVMIKDVISNIADVVVRLSEANSNRVSITITGDDFEINSDIATTLSLLLNELLQNSFKHAFSGRESGKIIIVVKKETQIYGRITVKDDGIGFKIDRNTSNLGMNIVKTLIKDKLKGSFHTKSSEKGTTVSFV